MRLATDELNLTLVVSRRFVASPERVFDAWFDPNAVGAWLFATPGGISKHVEIDASGGFAIHEQRGDSLATHFGTYLEIVRPNRIVFTFGTERQESTTVVMVDIRPDSGGGGLLTLTPSARSGMGSARRQHPGRMGEHPRWAGPGDRRAGKRPYADPAPNL